VEEEGGLEEEVKAQGPLQGSEGEKGAQESQKGIQEEVGPEVVHPLGVVEEEGFGGVHVGHEDQGLFPLALPGQEVLRRVAV